jgi:uncharacterized protein YqeY
MTLLERLYDDMKTAMKSGDKARLNVLRMTIAEIKKEAIDSGMTLGAAEETAILQRALKRRREAAESFEKGGRPELAAVEVAEAEILTGYMPSQVSDEELGAAVAALVASSGASSARDMGKVMGPLLAQFKGRLDGTRAKEAVMKALGG